MVSHPVPGQSKKGLVPRGAKEGGEFSLISAKILL